MTLKSQRPKINEVDFLKTKYPCKQRGTRWEIGNNSAYLVWWGFRRQWTRWVWIWMLSIIRLGLWMGLCCRWTQAVGTHLQNIFSLQWSWYCWTGQWGAAFPAGINSNEVHFVLDDFKFDATQWVAAQTGLTLTCPRGLRGDAEKVKRCSWARQGLAAFEINFFLNKQQHEWAQNSGCHNVLCHLWPIRLWSWWEQLMFSNSLPQTTWEG